MDAWERMFRDEAERDLCFIGEELREMANFVKIGRRAVNLDNVTEVSYEAEGGFSGSKACVIISFTGTNDYAAVYKNDEPETFSALMTWMDEQPALLSDEE